MIQESVEERKQLNWTTLIDAVTSLVVVLDEDGRILHFNRACEAVTQYSAEEVRGRRVWDLFPLPEEKADVHAAFAALGAEHPQNSYETCWLTKAGRCRFFHWTNTALIGKDGGVQQIVSTGADITRDRRKALLRDTSESLQRVSTAVLHKLTTLDDVLKLVCAEARQLIGAAGSVVLLLEGETRLRVAASDGAPSPIRERLPLADSLAGLVVNKRKPLLLNGFRGQIQTYYRNPDIKSLLAVPLRVDETIIGVLEVLNKPGGFSEDDVQITVLFADQAAIAIENAQLHEQAQQLAILEERQRLARELHDSVTQALYSVSLYVDATRMALAAGKKKVAGENLEELRKMAREAMLDMRLLIFELHPPLLEQEGLASALQARLEAVEARSGLHTLFTRQGEGELPLAVEEELYRIAQESLTNAVKHAQAQEVAVKLCFGDGRYTLHIQDDGLGFDPETARRSGGVGLRSIEERIRRIGADLEIQSTPGAGAILRVSGSIQ